MSQSHYIGLDVSARTVNLCVVDQDGRVAHERKLSSGAWTTRLSDWHDRTR